MLKIIVLCSVLGTVGCGHAPTTTPSNIPIEPTTTSMPDALCALWHEGVIKFFRDPGCSLPDVPVGIEIQQP